MEGSIGRRGSCTSGGRDPGVHRTLEWPWLWKQALREMGIEAAVLGIGVVVVLEAAHGLGAVPGTGKVVVLDRTRRITCPGASARIAARMSV